MIKDLKISNYNPKIDFKMVSLLCIDDQLKYSYKRLKEIFHQKIKPDNKIEILLDKTTKIFKEMRNKNKIDKSFLIWAVSLYDDIQLDIEKLNLYMEHFDYNKTMEAVYYASWNLRYIIKNNVFGNKSLELAILIFNQILYSNGYCPIVFYSNQLQSVKRLIETGVTVKSLMDCLDYFSDVSLKFNTKYNLLNKEDLIQIIHDSDFLINIYELKKAWLFGSFVRDESTIYSDVDLIVELTDFTLISRDHLKDDLVNLFERPVDLKIVGLDIIDFSIDVIEEKEVIFDVNK